MAIESLVIIGSGLAGYSVVKEFRQLNTTTPITLITADRGDYYSKPQLSTALAAGRDAAQLIMNTPAQMAEKFNMTVLTHVQVTHIDCHAKKIVWQDGELAYDQLVLALGADVVHPPLIGTAADTVKSVNTLEDYAQFRDWLIGKKRLALLGSGLVGCEFANDLLQANIIVDVISLDLYPLSRFVPQPIGRVMQNALAELGVHWHLGCCPIGIDHKDQGYAVQLSDGRSILVDGVFSAVGLRARTKLAEQAGLTVSAGIVVDSYLHTSDPNIYALGDCANVNGVMLQYIAPLLVCARSLAKTLAGSPTETHYPPMPIIVKTPACAMSMLAPPQNVQGAWVFDGHAPDVEARFCDAQGRLRGFALTGTMIKKRAILLKDII